MKHSNRLSGFTESYAAAERVPLKGTATHCYYSALHYSAVLDGCHFDWKQALPCCPQAKDYQCHHQMMMHLTSAVWVA